MNRRIKFIAEIVVVVALVGYIVNIAINPRKFRITDVTNYSQSEMNFDGLNEYVANNIPRSAIIYRLEIISPDWQWIAYLNKDSNIEFASIQNSSQILHDPQQEEISNPVSWSPDGQSFVATTLTGSDAGLPDNVTNKIVIFNLTADNKLERYEIHLSSVVTHGTPIIKNFRNRITWSPDGKFLAVITNASRSIIIIDSKANYLQTIPIRDGNAISNDTASNLFWIKNGLIYAYPDSYGSYYYRLMFVNPNEPLHHIEIIKTKGLAPPTILGIKDSYFLMANRLNPQKYELLLFNYDTFQVEKSFSIPADIPERDSGDIQNAPYTVFITKNPGFADTLWIFDWATLELRKSWIENYIAVTGWNPKLGGIGVFIEKNNKIQLWVVKP